MCVVTGPGARDTLQHDTIMKSIACIFVRVKKSIFVNKVTRENLIHGHHTLTPPKNFVFIFQNAVTLDFEIFKKLSFIVARRSVTALDNTHPTLHRGR